MNKLALLTCFIMLSGNMELIEKDMSLPVDNMTKDIISLTNSEEKMPQLDALQEEITRAGYQIGIAYMGKINCEIGNENNIRDFIKNYGNKYSFLKDAPIINAKGSHIYAVVTLNKDTSFEVYAAKTNNDRTYSIVKDQKFYQGKGKGYFILCCDTKGDNSNAVLVFKDKEKEFSISPSLSGIEGHLVETPYYYDFSAYYDDIVVPDYIMSDYSTLLESEYISEYLNQGMILDFTFETTYIDEDDNYCNIFALKDGENVYNYYAVCRNSIYYYDYYYKWIQLQ